MREQKISAFVSGTQNSVSNEIIAQDASATSLSWETRDGRVQLVPGRAEYGENTTIVDELDTPTDPSVGGCYDQIFVPRQDGKKLHYRKINSMIQVEDNGQWLEVIKNLTEFSNVFFVPYASLAGNFLYIGTIDGLYKINTANPRSYKDMFDETKNHKGYIDIAEARMRLWNRVDGTGDKTALYLSKIDPQGTNYTQVTDEAIAGTGLDFTHNLVEATGKRFVFNVVVTAGSVTGRDDQNGNIEGTGITGTINYATGVLDITFNSSATGVKVSYQYEDSNVGGITDFTFSSPRVAGEGDFIPQEYLGEAILNNVPFDNKYYSFKASSVYELDLTDDDTNATNKVFRTDIGISSPKGLCLTGKGIAYMDNANPDKPILSMLVRNPVGGNLEPINLTPSFAWENYRFDQCVMDTWGEYILVSCRIPISDQNDRLMLVNTSQKYSVDITYYGVKSLAKAEGLLYGGSAIAEVTYKLFAGNDDLGDTINNFWVSKNENFGDDSLKKVRYLELKGLIDPNQSFEVYVSYDDNTNILVKEITGTDSFVDLSSPKFVEQGISNLAGSELIGGDPMGFQVLGGGITNESTGDTIVAYPFHTRFKIATPKFRVRKLTFIGKGFGFLGLEMIKDFDILIFEQKIPKRYRVKDIVELASVIFGAEVVTEGITYSESSEEKYAIFGDVNTNGSWRLVVVGSDFKIQRLEGGSWVDKTSYTP